MMVLFKVYPELPHRIIITAAAVTSMNLSMESSPALKAEEKIEGKYYLVDQKNDMMQNLCGCFCEAANEYTVSESDPNFSVCTKKGILREDS
jgi:hypothetical protein